MPYYHFIIAFIESEVSKFDRIRIWEYEKRFFEKLIKQFNG